MPHTPFIENQEPLCFFWKEIIVFTGIVDIGTGCKKEDGKIVR